MGIPKNRHPFAGCAAGAALIFAAAALTGAETGSPARPLVTPEKPYVLYMGADVDLQKNKDKSFYRVRDVSRGAFVIRVEGKDERLPLAGATSHGVRISKSLKLTDKVVQVGELTTDRVYTLGRNPFRELVSNADNATASGQISAQDASRMVVAEKGAFKAQIDSTTVKGFPTTGPGSVVDTRALVTSTGKDFSNSSFAVGSDFNNAGVHANRMADEAGKEQYDAVEVKMRLSSSQALPGAYLVIVAQYREPDDKPGYARNWIYAEELPALTEDPRTVTVRQGGFPPGFALERCEVHFYSRGVEIASTQADKALALDRDGAHEYIVMEHVAAHKGGTLAPGLALGVDRGDLHPRYGSEQVQQTLYIKVNKDGLPMGAFRDEACVQRVEDLYLAGLVDRTRFKPALKVGKPVDGVVQLKIANLAL